MRPVGAWIFAAIFLTPVLAGLVGVISPAAGHMPQIGAYGPDLSAVRSLLDWPGLARAVWLSFQTGLAASILSLAVAILITARWSQSHGFAVLQSVISPFLAVPHAAAAFGLAFLIGPSGWLARLISPWATGWDRPPNLVILNDPDGLALIAGLTVKEAPYLILMMLGAGAQIKAEQARKIAGTLGYTPFAGWVKLIFPQIYRQIRLPMFIVISYSASAIDTALILGPQTPPTLAVQLLRWTNDPDLSKRMIAGAGVVLQLLVVLSCFGIWRLGEIYVGRLLRRSIRSGGRRGGDPLWSFLAISSAIFLAAAALLGAIPMAIWSVARFWSFPNILPDGLTVKNWINQFHAIGGAFGDSLLVAGLSVSLALGTVIWLLQSHAFSRTPLWIYLPLLIPQITFLPGLQVLLLGFGLGQGIVPVVIGHMIFVVPYLFLTLVGPWNALDQRYENIAVTLGCSPLMALWRIRLPLLLRPIMIAAALGTAVSVGLFLPTLLLGGGRVVTVTTETLALASGGNRRVLSIWSIVQTGMALIPFALAAFGPRLLFAKRRGMING